MRVHTNLTVLLGALCFFIAPAEALQNFATAKKALAAFYAALPQPETFYCHCPIFRERNGKMYPDIEACMDEGARFNPKDERTFRIEVEHIMPAWEFGHQMQCWRYHGRDYCQETSPKFNEIEGDLWDLVYAVGFVNKRRSYYRFSEWNAPKGSFGRCPMTVDSSFRQVQPPEYTRGLIARTYLYMAEKYNIKLSNQQYRMYQVWDKRYEPNRFECLRAAFIEQVQGDANPYLDGRCEL